MSALRIWNRSLRKIEEEMIAGEKAMRWLYESPFGSLAVNSVISKPWFSQLYGAYQDSSLSRREIPGFISKFGIDMSEFETTDYSSFNDFFIRKFKPDARTFVQTPTQMPAFAEGRYLAFEKTTRDTPLPIKGAVLNASALLGERKELAGFVGGPGFIARLCPVDYHRFHYPDDGTTLETFPLEGKLHSVNPIALAVKGDILFTNERIVSILETENFGKLAYIEVGALCVGKIVQSHTDKNFKRGDEKGYFLFGGSTVILLGEPGKWKPAADLIEQSAQGREALVKLGEPIATKTS